MLAPCKSKSVLAVAAPASVVNKSAAAAAAGSPESSLRSLVVPRMLAALAADTAETHYAMPQQLVQRTKKDDY